MKTIFSFGLISILLSTSLLAENSRKVKTDLEYDVGKGWWWYEETYVNDKKEEQKVKYSVTPEKKKELDDKEENTKLLKELLIVNQNILKEQKEIKDRLVYAFPDVTPVYTTNKKTGEECLTNSSMDCFVMPVIAEGQQIPVLKDFLREPSPEKAKSWLQWQATYFNHVQKVSHGLRFAFLKYGAEAYPTSTEYAYGDNLMNSDAENVRAMREAKVIGSLKEDIALLVFVGSNQLFETSNNVSFQISNWDKSYLKDLQKVFIFESEKNRDLFLETMSKKAVKEGEKTISAFWRQAKTVVKPELFESYKVKMTPSVVVFYEDKKLGKNISQTVLSGSLSSDELRTQIVNFLTYNEIIEAKEFSSDKNWREGSKKDNQVALPKASGKEIYEEYLKEGTNSTKGGKQ